MNFLKTLYNESISNFNKIKEYFSKDEKLQYTVFIPLIYNNIFIKSYICNQIINACYIIYLYENRIYFMGKIMNDIIYVKIIIDERVYKKNIFILNNVLLPAPLAPITP